MSERAEGTVVLGIDAAFKNIGWAAARLGDAGATLEAVGVIRTKAGEASQLKSEDNAQRSRELARGLIDAFNRFEPKALVLEAQSWPRVPGKAKRCHRCGAAEEGWIVDPVACGRLGMAFGLVFFLAELWEVPLIQVTPQRIKKVTTGFNNGKKEAVRLGLQQMRGFEQLEAMLQAAGIPQSYWEHPVDAAAAIYAALDTELGRTLRSLAA